MGKDRQFQPGSANFEQHYLEVTPEYIRVRPSRKLFFFYGVFAVLGLAFMVIFLTAKHPSGEEVWPVVLFGSVFFLIGAGLMTGAALRRTPCIDLWQKKLYPLGKSKRDWDERFEALPLSEAEKIDVSSHIASGGKSSYRCYTLSLVYPGGRSFVLLNHGAFKAFMRDARLLAQYTGLPLADEAFVQEIESENRRRDKAGGIPLLIFGLIWTVFSLFMHLQAWKMPDGKLFGVCFTGFFVLVGVAFLLDAFRRLTARFRHD